MKLATFSNGSDPTPRLGVVRDGGMIDLSVVPDAPVSMRQYLAAGGGAAERIAAAASRSAGSLLPLDSVRLHAPVPHPGKVLAIGLNYGDHIEESGMERPQTQVWFNKQHNCINDPYGDINLDINKPSFLEVD